jgi:hypothetical protein
MAILDQATTGKVRFVTLTKREATNIVGLLVAQLTDSTLIGNQSGACPTVSVSFMNSHDGALKLSFVLDGILHYSREFITQEQTIISLSKTDLINAVQLLIYHLANADSECPSIQVKNNSQETLYELVLKVERAVA